MISAYLHSCKVCDIEVCMHFFVNNTCDLAIALFTTYTLHMYCIRVIVSVILLHFSPTGFYSFTYYICHAICTPFTLFPLSPSHSSLSLSFLFPLSPSLSPSPSSQIIFLMFLLVLWMTIPITWGAVYLSSSFLRGDQVKISSSPLAVAIGSIHW